MYRNDQLGLVAFLAKKFGPTNKLGRKAFQKIVHLTSELVDVPTGYSFSFYTYGPYSRELAADLEYSEVLGSISSTMDSNNGGFDIQPGPGVDVVIGSSSDYIEKYFNDIEFIFTHFGGQSAKMLELYSTIVFVQNRVVDLDNDNLKLKVKNLKPKYIESEIESAILKLKEIRGTLPLKH